MAQAEQPERQARRVTPADIHQLVSSSTPHFALQLRVRIEKLIADLPTDDPARIEGERELQRLKQIAFTGEVRGEAQTSEEPMPSLVEDATF